MNFLISIFYFFKFKHKNDSVQIEPIYMIEGTDIISNPRIRHTSFSENDTAQSVLASIRLYYVIVNHEVRAFSGGN